MEGCVRLVMEFWLAVILLLGLLLGFWGVFWERMGREQGRRLFVGAMLVLGAGSVYGAFHRAEGLVPLGLAAGALVVAMLWGEPHTIEPAPYVES